MRRVALLTSLLGILASCQLLASLEPAEVAIPTCGARPPPVPARAADEGRPSRNLYFVVTQAELDSISSDVGFDVDCVDSRCTEGTEKPASCTRPEAKLSACDGDRGIDNVILAQLKTYGLAASSSDRYAEALARGERGLMLAIFGYSGGDDDSEVLISAFPSRGIVEPHGCSIAGEGGAPDAGFDRVPKLDGCDHFGPDERWVKGGLPTDNEVSGYVRGGHLYFDIGQSKPGIPLRFWFPYGTRDVESEVLYLDAKLERDSGGAIVVESAILGGRLRPRGLFEVFGEQRLGDDQEPFCRQPDWERVRKNVCDNMDLPAQNGAALDAPCAAMSFAVRLRTKPTLVGREGPRELPSSRCEGVPLDCVFDGDASALDDAPDAPGPSDASDASDVVDASSD